MKPSEDSRLQAVAAAHRPRTSPQEDPRITQALEEYAAAIDAGEKPDRQELLARFADVADELGPCLDGVEFIHEVAPQLSDQDTSQFHGQFHVRATIGDYRIIREIGRGGMGVVYEAEQLSLGRHVALKVLPFAAVMDRRHLGRFKNESQAAAVLQHQNIVPVYSVGCERGVHYYAMQYIAGNSLAEVVHQLRQLEKNEKPGAVGEETNSRSNLTSEPASEDAAPQPLSGRHVQATSTSSSWSSIHNAPLKADDTLPIAALSTDRSTKGSAYFRTVANLGIQAANALEHAHQHGVLHRDIKPANLLLDANGNLWITDFGLARIGTDPGLTLTGDLLGTLRYISPEQALAGRVLVDHRTDIYSLGVTLYELLTLRPAYEGVDRHELMRKISFDEPRAPTRINKAIPAELQTIVLKAMSKSSAERYSTAQELAEDLERFLEDKPIKARRPTLLQRASKWSRRHKALMLGLSTAALFILLTVVVASSLWAVRMEQVAGQQQELANNEQRARLDAERNLARRHMDYARLLCERGEVSAGMHWLAHGLGVAPADAVDLRQAIRANLAAWRPQLRSLHAVMQHQQPVTAVAFSPGDALVLTATRDGVAQLWDTATGNPIRQPMRHSYSVQTVAFSADGLRILTGCGDGTARLWDTRTCSTIGEPMHHEGQVQAVAFSRDGSRLLTATRSSIRVWDAATVTSVGKPQAIRHPNVRNVAFSPDGAAFLTASVVDGTTRLWNVATGDLIRELERGPAIEIRALVFSPDGSKVAAGSKFIWSWDVLTGKLINQSIRVSGMGPFTFSPDGSMILTGGGDGGARLWDVASGEPLGESVWHYQDWITAVAFSSDGSRIVTGGQDCAARLWDVPAWRPIGGPMLHKKQLHDVVFSRDGSRIVTASGTTAQLWDAATSKPIGPPLPHDTHLWCVALSPDGSQLLTGSVGGARLWDLATGEWTPIGLPKNQGVVMGVAFSPDGSHIATTSNRHKAQIWDAATLKPIGPSLLHEGIVRDVAFSPDGKLVLTGSYDQTAQLWETSTGKPVGEPMVHRGMVKAIAFSPNGRQVVTGLANGAVRLWDVDTRESIVLPSHHQDGLRSVAFSPDGLSFLTAALDGTARLWDAATGLPIGPTIEPGNPIYTVAFRPDGSRILVGDTGGVAQLWQSPPPSVEGDLERIATWTQVITGRELEPSGAMSVLDGPSWQQRRELLEELGGLPTAAVTIRPNPPVATEHQALVRHWTEAGRCTRQENWSEAVEHLDFLINAEPERSMHLLDRARAFAELGQWDDAVSDVAKATRLGADDRWVAKVAGDFLDLLGYRPLEEAETPYHEILQFWDKLATEYPDRPGYQVGLARRLLESGVLNRTGRHRDATQQWRETIARIDQRIGDNDTSKVATEERIRRLRATLDALVRHFDGELIVPIGSTWKWLHPTDGTDPATFDKDFHATFFKPDYDDSHWQTGNDSAGPKGGFGNRGNVGVNIGYPAEENRKTAYFRHTFQTNAAFEKLAISLQRDDGVIIYLDGVEVGHDNVGPGSEAYDLSAYGRFSGMERGAKIKGDGVSAVYVVSLSGTIEPGEHVLAISLHNEGGPVRIAEISLLGQRMASQELNTESPLSQANDKKPTERVSVIKDER